MNKQRVAFTALAALVWPLLFWVSGIDLNERGSDQAVALSLSILTAGYAWFFPGWRNNG